MVLGCEIQADRVSSQRQLLQIRAQEHSLFASPRTIWLFVGYKKRYQPVPEVLVLLLAASFVHVGESTAVMQ